MLKELKRIYLEGWNDDVGVRLWSWLLSIVGAVLVGVSGVTLVMFYKPPVIVSYTPCWVLLGIGFVLLFAACFGMVEKLSEGKNKARGRR